MSIHKHSIAIRLKRRGYGFEGDHQIWNKQCLERGNKGKNKSIIISKIK